MSNVKESKKAYHNVSVKMSPEEKEALEQYAKSSYMSMSAVFRKALDEYMQNHPLNQ